MLLASKPRKREHTIALRGGTMAPVYKIVIRPCEDVGGYWAACDMEKGGCTVQGKTMQETQVMMFESVAFYLEDYPEITNYRLEFEYSDA